MKRIYKILGFVLLSVTVWLRMLAIPASQDGPWSALERIPYNVKLLLPLIAVVAYGLFNLVLVIIKIVRFNTYPQEYKSLLEDIKAARKEFKGKGIMED